MRFLSSIVSVPMLLGTMACVTTTPMGGVGQTQSGAALSAEAQLGSDLKNTIVLSSIDGWSCSGAYVADRQSAIRQFPLSCSNGASGQATLVNNAPTAGLAYQRATLTFRLNNGQQGTVQFGLLS